MKRSTLRSQGGFSLVELMVVVAIIGVLAAMSAGQVQKQIAKARQSEAKTNLSSLWTAMESFRAEWNQYTTDFVATKLSYSGRLYYHVGFNAAFAVPTAYTNSVGAAGADNAAISTATVQNKTCNNCQFMPGVQTPVGTASATGFTAQAGGQPINGTNDFWQITNEKLLTNPTPGVL